MKFRYDEHHDDLAGWALIHAIAKLTDEKLQAIVGDRQGEHDVVLTLNGHEIDFVDVLRELDRQRDRQIAEAAEQLVEERLSEFLHRVHEVAGKVDHAVRQHAMQLLGVELPKEDP